MAIISPQFDKLVIHGVPYGVRDNNIYNLQSSSNANKALFINGSGNGIEVLDVKIQNGIITIGNNSVTPLTQHQDISGKADKSTTTAAGTYKSVTVNSSGIVTGGTNPTTLTDYGITDAYTKAEIYDSIITKIPSQATSSNQLADKDFVNSSIATNTANYISNNGQPFNSVAELSAYSGTVTNNDYAFVTGTDSEGNTYFDRYKATVDGTIVTWAKEFRLNNSSFTAVQWSAIESGITSDKVSDYDGYATQIDEKADKASITGGTAGTSAATDGSSLDVPYVTVNSQGIVTEYGTHVHTVSGFLVPSSVSGYTLTNVVGVTGGTVAMTGGTTRLKTGVVYLQYE